MSPSSPGSRAALLAAVALSAASARAEARLDITGIVEGVTEETIEIRVDLTNRGPEKAEQVVVTGELFGAPAEARLGAALAVGAHQGVTLRFPMDAAAPGVHAVALMLDYHTGPAATATGFSQPAWVLIALGGNAEPAVKMYLGEAQVEVAGRLDVGLESADGAPHRVRLVLTMPRGLRAHPVDSLVDVPAQGRVTAPIRLFRVDAPWQSRQGILVVARDESGPLVRTAVGAATAQLTADPARLPRVRRGLIGTACVLLAAAVALEIWRRRAQQATA